MILDLKLKFVIQIAVNVIQKMMKPKKVKLKNSQLKNLKRLKMTQIRSLLNSIKMTQIRSLKNRIKMTQIRSLKNRLAKNKIKNLKIFHQRIANLKNDLKQTSLIPLISLILQISKEKPKLI